MLRQGRDGQEGIYSQCRWNQRTVGDEKAIVNGSIPGEQTTILIDGPVQVVLTNRTAANRMSRDQMPQLKDGPHRVLDKCGTLDTGVAEQLLIDPGENDLAARAVPFDL